MKISLIAGSHRKNSESNKVAKYMEAVLQKNHSVSTFLFSLSSNPLPLFDEDFYAPENEKWAKSWAPIATEFQSSDAFVIVTPEWHGMVPAGLKNLFLLATPKEFGHKPALITSVSSGTGGGAYPVNELRTSSYKNNRICYLPEHIIIRDCANLLNTEIPANPIDEAVRNRINFTTNLLVEYAKALRNVRESKVIDYKSFAFGM